MFIIIYNIAVKLNFIIKINNYKHFVLQLIINIIIINETAYDEITLFIF